MMAETLCLVSNSNCLEDFSYLSLSSSPLYHSAVYFNPSGKEVWASQPKASLAFFVLANQSLRSHLRLGMVLKVGDSLIPKTFEAAFTTSAIVVFLPLPMLKESP